MKLDINRLMIIISFMLILFFPSDISCVTNITQRVQLNDVISGNIDKDFDDMTFSNDEPWVLKYRINKGNLNAEICNLNINNCTLNVLKIGRGFQSTERVSKANFLLKIPNNFFISGIIGNIGFVCNNNSCVVKSSKNFKVDIQTSTYKNLEPIIIYLTSKDKIFIISYELLSLRERCSIDIPTPGPFSSIKEIVNLGGKIVKNVNENSFTLMNNVIIESSLENTVNPYERGSISYLYINYNIGSNCTIIKSFARSVAQIDNLLSFNSPNPLEFYEITTALSIQNTIAREVLPLHERLQGPFILDDSLMPFEDVSHIHITDNYVMLFINSSGIISSCNLRFSNITDIGKLPYFKGNVKFIDDNILTFDEQQFFYMKITTQGYLRRKAMTPVYPPRNSFLELIEETIPPVFSLSLGGDAIQFIGLGTDKKTSIKNLYVDGFSDDFETDDYLWYPIIKQLTLNNLQFINAATFKVTFIMFYNFQSESIESIDLGSLLTKRLSPIELFPVPKLITSLGVRFISFNNTVNAVGNGLTEINGERRLFFFMAENVFSETLGINTNTTRRDSVTVISNNPFPIFFGNDGQFNILRLVFINQQQNDIVNIGTINVTVFENSLNVELISPDTGIFVNNKTNKVKARVRDANVIELISNGDIVRTFFLESLSYFDFDVTRNIFYLSEKFTLHALKIFRVEKSYRPDQISELVFDYEDYFNITSAIRGPRILLDKSVFLRPLSPSGIAEDYSITIMRPDPDIFEEPESRFWIALIPSLLLVAITLCVIITYNAIQLSRFVRVEIPSETHQ